MEELKLLYLSVTSNDASCGMNKAQIETFKRLNEQYNKLSGSRVKYCSCKKTRLIKAVKDYIDANASN